MGSQSSKKARHFAHDIPDWHLWSEVTRSVSPLARPNSKNRETVKNRTNAKGRTTGAAGSQGTPCQAQLSQAQKSQQRHLATLENRHAKKSSTGAPGSKTQHSRSTPSQSALTHAFLPNIEPRIHRRLRRGQVLIDASIDLHGLHQKDAHAALYRFIEARLALGDRTLLIITGKGLKKTGFGQIEQRGVLRHMLPIWLKEPALAPLIAGFETSARQHGGEGAYYVRLKRAR